MVQRRRSLLLILCLPGLLPLACAAAAGARCTPAKSSLPHWAKARRMTVVHDSVLLSGEAALRRGFPCWHVQMVGRPALMLPAAQREIQRRGRVAPLVVVGVGYNTLWERNGRRHAYWAARFRREASSLIAALRRAGAEPLVWVTLRRVNRRTTSPRNWGELHYYSWYFGWVNDELRTLDQQRDRLVLADWEHVGARPDVTYDSIHL